MRDCDAIKPVKVMCLFFVEKGVDKPKGVCYTVQAVSERHTRVTLEDGANLENDTEKRENRTSRCEDLSNQGALRGEKETVRFEELNAGSKGKRALWRAPVKPEDLEKD